MFADSIGPFADGITYYSTATVSSGNSVTSTSSGAEVAASLPMTTFTSGQCDAAGSASVTGATLTGALLNSSGELIADNSGISQCAGVSKLLGVANLSTSITISASTKALKATFTVENNGSTIFCSDGSCSDILVGSGPFNVAFTVVE